MFKNAITDLIYKGRAFQNPLANNISTTVSHLTNEINNGDIKSAINYLIQETNITIQVDFTAFDSAINNLLAIVNQYENHTNELSGKVLNGTKDINSIIQLGVNSLEDSIDTEYAAILSPIIRNGLDLNINAGISDNHPLAPLYSAINKSNLVFNKIHEAIEEVKKLKTLFLSTEYKNIILALPNDNARIAHIQNTIQPYININNAASNIILPLIISDNPAYIETQKKVFAKAVTENVVSMADGIVSNKLIKRFATPELSAAYQTMTGKELGKLTDKLNAKVNNILNISN